MSGKPGKPGKPGNIREFDSCLSGILLKVREVSVKILSGKSCLKLFIVNNLLRCRYSVRVYSVLNIKYMVWDHVLLYSYPHH